MGAVGTFADILLFKKVVNFITVVSHDCIISEGFGFTREGMDNIGGRCHYFIPLISEGPEARLPLDGRKEAEINSGAVWKYTVYLGEISPAVHLLY